jgi:solute carrier family 25 (mitochondrial carnitine/acylcarnitine transporter), member 20/29
MSPIASHGQDMEEQVESPKAKTPVSQTSAQIRSFVAGGVGGLCAVLVGHPFDLVKVRLQTAERGVYGGAIDVVKKTIAREGVARVCTPFARIGFIVLNGTQGLYAGVSAPLVGVTPMCKYSWVSRN